MDLNALSSRLDLAGLVSGFILSVILASISIRFRALSKSGGLGMILIGTIVFGLGGIMFAVPMVFFFISSSLISFINSPVKRVAMIIFEKTGPRDIMQVLANGGVGTVCVIVYFVTGDLAWFFPYLASLCAAAADTWATELGTLSKKPPVSIITLKRVDPGRSGGVTIGGFLAAAAGSATVMLSGYMVDLVTHTAAEMPLTMWLVSFNAGFAGSVLDSILGGSVQAMYRCPLCSRITERREHCGDTTIPESGWLLINNDMVNFISILFAAGAVLAIFWS